jgi:hypothetical protein
MIRQLTLFIRAHCAGPGPVECNSHVEDNAESRIAMSVTGRHSPVLEGHLAPVSHLWKVHVSTSQAASPSFPGRLIKGCLDVGLVGSSVGSRMETLRQLIDNGDFLYIKWQRSIDVATVAVAVWRQSDVSDSKLSPLRPPLLLVGEVNLGQKEKINSRFIASMAVHAFYDACQVPRHLSHCHGRLDTACDGVDPACEADEV